VNLWQSVLAGTGDTLPPAPLVSFDEHDSGPYGMAAGTSSMDMTMEDRLSEECAALASGLAQVGQVRLAVPYTERHRGVLEKPVFCFHVGQCMKYLCCAVLFCAALTCLCRQEFPQAAVSMTPLFC